MRTWSRPFTWLAALGLALALALAPSTPAHADDGSLRWESNVFCVDDQTTSGNWPVLAATVHVGEIDGITMIYQPGCEGWAQAIPVREGTWKGKDGQFTGLTWWTPDGARITSANIQMNNHRANAWTSGARLMIVEHELLHAIGIRHNDSPESIMGPVDTAILYRSPTARDAAEVRALYAPRGYTYRPAWRYAS